VRAGQPERVAQEVDEQQARLDVRGDGLAVDVRETCMVLDLLGSARSAARRRARWVSSAASGACTRPSRGCRRWGRSLRGEPGRLDEDLVDGGLPFRRLGLARARRRDPTAVSATPASDARAVDLQHHRRGGDGQSPARRLTFSCALAGVVEQRDPTSTSISPSATAVVRAWWNSSTSSVRSPPGPRTTMRAPSAAQTAERSSAGSAWHSAPPIVRGCAPAGRRSRSPRRGRREPARELVGLEQVAVPCQRADAHLAALLADVAQLGLERVDVDEVLRRGEPQLHHRQQRLSSGDEPRLGSQAFEQRDRFLHAGGAGVVERRGHLHGAAPLSGTSPGEESYSCHARGSKQFVHRATTVRRPSP